MSNLNNACVFVTSKYRAVYDIEEVNAEQKIWKGKPVPLPIKQEGKRPSMLAPPGNSWTFFSRMYHDENDWDRFYPEIGFKDEDIAGVPFLLIPIEKVLFGYEPPTDGIVLPGQAIIGAEN